MLVNFQFENCRLSFRENNLSPEAVKDNELQELNTSHVKNESPLNVENKFIAIISDLSFGKKLYHKPLRRKQQIVRLLWNIKYPIIPIKWNIRVQWQTSS